MKTVNKLIILKITPSPLGTIIAGSFTKIPYPNHTEEQKSPRMVEGKGIKLVFLV